MGGMEALAGFLTLEGAWAPVRAAVRVGLQKDSGHPASARWLRSCTFLAEGESLWMRNLEKLPGG